MPERPHRGQCPVCKYRYALRKDGTLQAHHGYIGHERQPDCKGGGQLPVPFDPNDCAECMEHRFSTPGLMEACFSVAIESPRKTAEALMRDYLTGYHERGHAGE